MATEARMVEESVLIIDGWGEKEPEGNHTTNYREINVTGTYNYSPVILNSNGVYLPFDTGIGTVVNSYIVNYGTRVRREDE